MREKAASVARAVVKVGELLAESLHPYNGRTMSIHYRQALEHPELELRLFAHAVGRPRWIEDQFDRDALYPLDGSNGVFDFIHQFLCHGAARGGKGHNEEHLPLVGHLNGVNQPKVVDIAGDFGVVDRLEYLHEVALYVKDVAHCRLCVIGVAERKRKSVRPSRGVRWRA